TRRTVPGRIPGGAARHATDRAGLRHRQATRRGGRGIVSPSICSLRQVVVTERMLYNKHLRPIRHGTQWNYNPAGGGEMHGPDLELEDDDSRRSFRIDSKTFDCQPHKRFFLINNKKHEELRPADP